MSKVVCCAASSLNRDIYLDTKYFSLFSPPPIVHDNIGYIAPTLFKDIQKMGINPSVEVWDFTAIALSVDAADKYVLRNESADGWTRVIDLSIAINQPEKWDARRKDIETLLRFLTGDFWTLHFLPGGVNPPITNIRINREVDSVCLLSGGVDSLVGAIDLVSLGYRPILVSQTIRGDKYNQKLFASELVAENQHFQWSCTINHKGKTEPSTRGRSIVFFAYALLATSAIPTNIESPAKIYVPENGFISLNIPLGPGRIGSLSTKTTHPVYMKALQDLWNAIGISVQLICPYQFKTKGEMLVECINQPLLHRLVDFAVSCGKYRRYGYKHCGTCVPCLVRRAAYIKAGMDDNSRKGYVREHIISTPDVSAVATSYTKYKTHGIKILTGGHLSFASHDSRVEYENVIARGMDELGVLLERHNIL